MNKLYTHGTVVIDGTEYDAEAEYEIWEGGIVIHAVSAIRQVAAAGEIWYDRNGSHWVGPKFIPLDVTEWVNIEAWKEEIKEHEGWWESVKRRAA